MSFLKQNKSSIISFMIIKFILALDVSKCIFNEFWKN